MRQLLIVSGVLGGGTALVFTAAALVSALSPTGALIPASPWGSDMRFVGRAPAIRGPILVDRTTDGGVLDVPMPIGPLRVDTNTDVVVPPGAEQVIVDRN